jgi:hypothetical protein
MRMRVIAILVFGLAGCSSAPRSAETSTTASRVGSVEGVVRSRDTGKPFADLVVRIDDGSQHQARTDEHGRFELDAVPIGRHSVNAYYQDVTATVTVDVATSEAAEVVVPIDESAGCTMNTCSNSLAINFENTEQGLWIDAHTRLSGEIDGEHFDCATLLDHEHECDYGYAPSCTGVMPDVLHVLVTKTDPSKGCSRRLLEQVGVSGNPKLVQLTITGTGVTISRTLRPEYAGYDPNGTKCPPHCSTASEALTW